MFTKTKNLTNTHKKARQTLLSSGMQGETLYFLVLWLSHLACFLSCNEGCCSFYGKKNANSRLRDGGLRPACQDRGCRALGYLQVLCRERKPNQTSHEPMGLQGCSEGSEMSMETSISLGISGSFPKRRETPYMGYSRDPVLHGLLTSRRLGSTPAWFRGFAPHHR